jgi:hypothetical protein
VDDQDDQDYDWSFLLWIGQAFVDIILSGLIVWCIWLWLTR